MLKRLFLVMFILQSFATGAWAGMDMSQLNQAEKSKMQIMHHVMNMDEMPTILSPEATKSGSQMHSMMDCSLCDQETGCQDFMCGSIHAATPFYAQVEMIQPTILMVNSLTPTLSISVKYSNSQPETPPPSI
jgi:hypothetical protein